MSYDPTLLSSVAVYRVRFNLQDTDPYNEFLCDEEIQYVVDKYPLSENIATLECAKRMLGQFAQYARQREGLIEVYGSEVFDNWKDYLSDLVKDLSAGGGVGNSKIIIGGVVKSEVDRVNKDSESVSGGYSKNFIANKQVNTISETGKASDNPFRLS